MKLLLIILSLQNFLFFSTESDLDNESKQIIEKKLSKSQDSFLKLNLFNALIEAEEAISIAKEKKYLPGIIKGKIYLSKIFIEAGDFNRSIQYLNASEKYLKKTPLIDMNVEVHRLKGINYSNLGMDNLALAQFKKQLDLSQKLDDENKRNLSSFWAFQNMTHIYTSNKNDSALTYLNIQKKHLSKLDYNKHFLDYSNTYAQIGTQFINDRNIDSASYYLNKSLNILKEKKHPYLYFTYQKFGDLYDLKNEKLKAISFYKKALDNAKEINHLNAIKNSYKILSDYLVSNNINKAEAADYYYNYQKINDSLSIENKKVSDMLIKHTLKTENKDVWDNQLFKYLTIIVTILLLLSAVIISYMRWNKKERKKIINKLVEVEDKYLNDLNNKKFDQLLELSKSNSPEFIVLFKELYPCFVSKLKELDKNIRSSELAFCAMLYLNYSTKDIAEYTFVSVRAVQVRKNRLRKKYNISSDIDLNKWMRSLCN